LPWCITLLFVSALALLRVHALRTARVSATTPKVSRNQQLPGFMESCAISYVLFSLSVSGWMLFHHFHASEPLVVKRQVVDIQLTSLNDFSDRHELLPSSKLLPILRQRSATAKVDRQGALSSVPIVASAAAPAGASVRASVGAALAARHALTPVSRTQDKKTALTKRTTTAQWNHSRSSTPPIFAESHFVISQPQPDQIPSNERVKPSQSNPSVNHVHQTKNGRKNHNEIFLEEVAPPDMVELVDSQGDASLEVWQPGGHSTQGTGSHSLLVDYLKYLHRRIKKAWSPPSGETRSAEILFRIRRDGRLFSLKLVNSSGDSSSDEAAMHAIASCSPFKALPSDYTPEYIDLQYTFNYKVDQLTEITESRAH
jgi:TonB family protein